MSTFLYGANVHANGIRQHYLRYGGNEGERAGRDAVVIVPGITSPAITWGFVAERFGQHFDTYVLDVRGRGLSQASDTLDYSLDTVSWATQWGGALVCAQRVASPKVSCVW